MRSPCWHVAGPLVHGDGSAGFANAMRFSNPTLLVAIAIRPYPASPQACREGRHVRPSHERVEQRAAELCSTWHRRAGERTGCMARLGEYRAPRIGKDPVRAPFVRTVADDGNDVPAPLWLAIQLSLVHAPRVRVHICGPNSPRSCRYLHARMRGREYEAENRENPKADS